MKKTKTKATAKLKKRGVPTEPPKRWRGIVVLDRAETRASVHPLKNKDGSRLDAIKLKEIMDRQFVTEAPHRVFYAVELRDEPTE